MCVFHSLHPEKHPMSRQAWTPRSSSFLTSERAQPRGHAGLHLLSRVRPQTFPLEPEEARGDGWARPPRPPLHQPLSVQPSAKRK